MILYRRTECLCSYVIIEVSRHFIKDHIGRLVFPYKGGAHSVLLQRRWEDGRDDEAEERVNQNEGDMQKSCENLPYYNQSKSK